MFGKLSYYKAHHTIYISLTFSGLQWEFFSVLVSYCGISGNIRNGVFFVTELKKRKTRCGIFFVAYWLNGTGMV